jgi:hypothetical protein
VNVRPLVPEDLDWLVGVLRTRRERLVPHAPVFWRPAQDAVDRHRDWLGHLLGDGGARGWRTGASALVAAPTGNGWLLDDVVLADDDWAGEGAALWQAFATTCPGDPVRFVCPVPEPTRADFARGRGLVLHESWWLQEFDGPSGGEAGVEVSLGGSVARTVAAPPVYDPPGPVLFLPGPASDDEADAVRTALRKALGEAPRLGCPAVVVSQSTGDDDLAAALQDAGFRRHCDFLTGLVG